MPAALALGLALVLSQDPTPPQGLEEGTRVLTLQAGLLDSASGDEREILLWSGRLGLAHRFRERFALVGELDGAIIDGDPGQPLPDADTSGFGASVLLRWHALAGERWSLFFEHGLGLLATQADFPPGGTGFNGTRQVGAGLSFELVPGTSLTAGVRQQHVSNGRGLVDDNPSWDGYGVYLGLALDRTPAGRAAAPARAFEAVPPAPFDVRLDAYAADLDGASGAGARLALDARLTGNLFGGLRASQDDADGEDLREVGAALYLRGARGLAGLAYDRQELEVFRDDEWSLFAELYPNDLVTVAGVLAYEHRNALEDLVRGGVMLRVYPFDALMVASGFGLVGERDGLDANDLDVPLALEWSPAPARAHGVSVFAAVDLEDTRRVGLRWRPRPAHAGSLLELHRASGPLRDQL